MKKKYIKYLINQLFKCPKVQNKCFIGKIETNFTET